MKVNTINPSSFNYEFDEKIHNHPKKYYFKGEFGIPFYPCLICFLGITSIFSFFFVYFYNPFHFSSQSIKQFPHQPTNYIKPQYDEENCDLFKGKWVRDENGTQYTTSSCLTIPESKNCFKNGRNDTDFLNWRWKPYDCELPRFDPIKFLQIVGGKKMAFLGDSVARNHMESLLCLLSQVETPVDVYKDSEDRFRKWHFPSSNFTLMTFWSKFLVQAEEIMVNDSGTGSFNLHLDKVNKKWASKLYGLDYLIISDAHWFFRKNYLYNENKLIGCVYCNERNITELGLNYALRIAFRTAMKYINNCKECNKGMVTLVRTFSPAHFENGGWDSGGGCNSTRPRSDEKGKGMEDRWFELEVRKVQVEELVRAREEAGEEGKNKFRCLDVTNAMLMRPDGHPGEFWGNKWMKGYNDCVHWCMPGPIDVWSDFLFAVL
ncbi:xyloglucan O-acetyltransferase 4 [Amaranthus tricolor]|uniref:xyloglucan O-acetyltransferase 4 n=1 Tax=Amaranthus tricolor TaxID=29722 RepID=UPI0025843042|nr:xyloglucan O-acetyltransferase 4 [Amaranthus tricolor]